MSGASHAARVRVRYAETDAQGVAYHAHYLVWMEIGRTAYLEAVGFPYAGIEAEGLFFAVSEARCRYAGAARYDDEVVVETTVRAVRSRAVDFAYALSVGGRAIADGETTLVALGGDRRPRRIPPAVADALRARL